jgi:hypothetical protein
VDDDDVIDEEVDDEVETEQQEDDDANPEDEDDEDADDTASADGDADGVAALDYGDWRAAKQNGINVAKALAVKVAATKHALAGGVLKEINSIIGFVNKLPDNPSSEDIDKITASIQQHEAIADAEDAPDHVAGKVDIKSPLLKALEGLRR